MPAITAIATVALSPVARGVANLVEHGQRAFRELVRRLRNRRDARRLAELDVHMLKDIGLTRSDLRDAYSEPLWRDPTDMLARRAAERQGKSAYATNELFPSRPGQYPSLDRPCRYFV